MRDPLDYAEVFLAALDDPGELSRLYAEWLDELMARPLWSPSTPEGRRIPWRLAPDAHAHLQKAEFARPGCYAFGAGAAVLRYIGMTGAESSRTLSDRVFGRHLLKHGRLRQKRTPQSGSRVPCQLFLAEDYEEAILSSAAGLLQGKLPSSSGGRPMSDLFSTEQYESVVRQVADTAFPKELRDKYLRNHNDIYRFLGAVDYVLHGLEGIWFTLLPLDDRTRVKALEEHLIRLANSFNLAHGHKSLCQEGKRSGYRSHLDGARP